MLFCWNYFHCAAWLIFNHYSVWLSSLSGLSAFHSWPTVRPAEMPSEHLRRRAFLTGRSHALRCCSAGPAHLGDCCQCQSAGQRASRRCTLQRLTPPPSPSPSQPSLRLFFQLLCCSAFVLSVVPVSRSGASCASRSWELHCVQLLRRPYVQGDGQYFRMDTEAHKG